MNELPEQREANLRVMEQLQLQYQRLSDNLRGAQDRKLIIQKQLNEMKLAFASESNLDSIKEEKNLKEEKSDSLTSTPSILTQSLPLVSKGKPKMKNPYELQLDQLRNHLSDLDSKYTEKHPDVLVAKKKIADLENKIEKVKAIEAEEEITKVEMASTSETLKKGKGEEIVSLESNPFYKEMESQLTATEFEIKRLKDEEPKIKAKIAEFQMRVENAPARELGMANITRDYQNNKETYQSLLRKSQEAQQAENLERRQKGEQFKVIDPARIPGKPFKPNIPRIILFGFLLGMCSGFGMAIFREQMDRSFRDAEDLETTLGFKVLANIPKIEKKAA